MPDNLSLGAEAQVNHIIALMQKEKTKGAIHDGAQIFPDAFFGVDPEGKVKGQFETGDGCALKLSYRVIEPVRWVGLHLRAGHFSLDDKSIVGVICKSQADHAITSRLCLRSGFEGGFEDSFLPKHLVSYSEASTHIDLIQIEKSGYLSKQALWRELLFFLPCTDTDINIQELKFFIV